MSAALDNVSNNKTNILVVGDAVLAQYWRGTVERISPEAPVPVIKVQDEFYQLSGAANIAQHCRNLAVDAVLLTGAGNDSDGARLRALLQDAAISAYIATSVQTLKWLRIFSDNQQMSNMGYAPKQNLLHNWAELLTNYQQQLPHSSYVILADYSGGTIVDAQELIALATQHGKKVLVDPNEYTTNWYAYRGAYAIILNNQEWRHLRQVLNLLGDDDTAAQIALHTLNVELLLLTAGGSGMTLFGKDGMKLRVPGLAREVLDLTGAGETVAALFTIALHLDMNLSAALDFANAGAHVVVKQFGVAVPSWLEIETMLANFATASSHQEQTTVEMAIAVAKLRGEKIVMTNGCFDVLHIGHIEYLAAARQLGQRLLVAINADTSIQQIKGPGRPYFTLQERMQVLSAFSFVDWVVSFYETTPCNLISKLKPDVLVKGNDYTVDEVVGGDIVRAYGGMVHIVHVNCPGYSSSNLINNLRQQHG